MKINPKTKHSKKFIAEKNGLISKAVFGKKLDAFKSSICEYLESNPIKIACDDIKDEYRYTVFISVSDGKSRARVCHASASDFDSSWAKVCKKVNKVIDRYKITPVWIKADIVDSVQRIFYSDIKDAFLSAKYQKFFRMGFSLDPRMDLAFLEAEANSYGLYDYSVIPMKASKPGHENIPCINIEQVAKYLEWNGNKTIPLILPYTYFFTCKSFFMDMDK